MFRAIRFFAGMILQFAAVATARAQGAAQTAPASGVGALWETIAHGIINPWVTILLLFAGCFLLFVDLLTPKTWEWMGTLGVLAVGMVFAAHVSEGTGGWVGVVLMLVGVGLLLLETHVFPGGGVAAIAGIIALSLGMFTALGGTHNTVFALPVAGFLTMVAVVAFFAYLPKSPLWKQITREMRQASGGGFDVAPVAILPGLTATTITTLRPSGMAQLADGTRLSVITEGDFLPAHAPVQVTHVDGGRVVVELVAGTIHSDSPLVATER